MSQNQQNQNEKTSSRAAQIAAKAMQNPSSLSPEEVKQLAASVLNQSPNQQSSQQGQQGQQNQQKR